MLALGMSAPALAQSEDAQTALSHFREARPLDEDLVMYRLDWARTFEEAKSRAAKENRPLCVIAVHARYGDLFTGHC
ncbi:MAG: hypothetical protein HYZ53_04395 [Planctomycetes bacterium]|nr:hypothetical protein [Planctomycetota bacterium]